MTTKKEAEKDGDLQKRFTRHKHAKLCYDEYL